MRARARILYDLHVLHDPTPTLSASFKVQTHLRLIAWREFIGEITRSPNDSSPLSSHPLVMREQETARSPGAFGLWHSSSGAQQSSY